MSRKPDEIMAEYLLTGNKMLSETCKTCGAPLFEVKGKKLCVVCAENEAAKAEAPKMAEARASVPENVRVIVPEYAKAAADEGSAPASQTELACALDVLISEFCERAHNESDASVCLTLMECVRTAAEAKMMLNRK